MYRFGSFEISPDEKLLRREGQPVSLPPKAVETLLLLIKSPGEVVSKEEILQTVWPDVVVEENNLTQQISILRKALGNGEASWIQTVPKRGYRFAGHVTAVEKPRVVPGRQEIEEPVPIPRPRHWRRLPASLGAVVVLIALVVVLASFARRPDQIRSVAVLPIQPLAAGDELSSVGLGVSDAVVQRLSYARAFEVRPISSVRKYLGRSVDPVAVGKELNVDAVIAGTIQRNDDRYRVTMELIDVRTNRSRWSGKIDEKASDLFRLQDVVAEAMMRSLSAETKARPPRKSPVPEAHEAFLKGRYYWSRRTGDDVERAVAEFERAVSIDDSYAPAWAGLASALNLQSLHFINEPRTSFARSRSAARQAMLLDPELAEAHAAMGFVNFYHDWKWAEAEKAFRRAIELDRDNGNYRQLLSNLLMATGRFEEGIEEIQEAMRSDPASIMVRSVAGRQYYLARQYDESAQILRKTIAMDSSFAPAHFSLGATFIAMGRHPEARLELEEAVRRGIGAQAQICLALVDARTGQADKAKIRIGEARALTRNGADIPYDIAAVLGALGDRDAAFALLDRAIAERYSGMVWLNVDPRMDSLRSDPRMPEYARRVGLPIATAGS